MRTVRGKKVIGWKVVNSPYKTDFENELNGLMDKYEFIDCQYVISVDSYYSALVLLAERKVKNER